VFGEKGEKVEGVDIKRLLGRLIAQLRVMDAKGQIPRMEPYPTHLGDPRGELACLPPPHPDAGIEQHDFWRRISNFFKEGDVILTETGTPSVGSREFVLPRNARLINSSIWLSIGFMMAAACGAALGAREILQQRKDEGVNGDISHREQGDDQKGLQWNGKSHSTSALNDPPHRHVLSSTTASGRTILFEGDGSFQMTAQELSTVISHKLDLTLFLINNDGYTIERFIHGMKAHYNDVARWRYLDAPYFFGADMTGEGEEREWEGNEAGTGAGAGEVAVNGTVNGDGGHEGVLDVETGAEINGHARMEGLGCVADTGEETRNDFFLTRIAHSYISFMDMLVMRTHCRM
jgi:TPP-dependent 2-oxoacid decarboxylase